MSGQGPRLVITGALAAFLDKERRDRRKISWVEAAKETGIDRGTLSRALGAHHVKGGAGGWEDPRHITSSNLGAIFQMLTVSSDTLLPDGTLVRDNITPLAKDKKVVVSTASKLSEDEMRVLELYMRLKQAMPERAEPWRRELEKLVVALEYGAERTGGALDADDEQPPDIVEHGAPPDYIQKYLVVPGAKPHK